MAEAPEPLRRRVRARALRGLTAGARVLPEALLGTTLGATSGVMRFTRYQRVVLDNLELALGDTTTLAEREHIARGVWRHSARLFAEWIRLSQGNVDSWLERHVEFDDSIGILDPFLESGQGLLAPTGHIGNWEVLTAAIKQRGYEGFVVGRHRARDSSSDWLIEMRRAYGVESIAQDASPRRALETLRRGHALGIVADLEVRRLASEFIPFFGRPALTMTAPAALARAARLPLVPMRCTLRGGRYLVQVEEPLYLDRELERGAAATNLLARLNLVYERWIRETPEQWAWHQPRWRTQPEEPRDHGRPLQAR